MAGFRMAATIALLAWAYALVAVVQLPNDSSFDARDLSAPSQSR
jgi:hypothetical protein